MSRSKFGIYAGLRVSSNLFEKEEFVLSVGLSRAENVVEFIVEVSALDRKVKRHVSVVLSSRRREVVKSYKNEVIKTTTSIILI